MIPSIFGLFIFCMVNTGGKIGLGHLSATSSAGGTNGWGWFFVWAVNAGMGNTATLITNQPDYARWSKTKTGAMWSQLFTSPIAVTLSASLGILSTAAINNAWGLALWNQWDLLDAIMTRYWSGTTRFAVFLAAAGWSVSILGTNIAANMIPFGSDSTMLFPRFITIPRGQFIVECLGFAICPWKILASASTFTTFLAGCKLCSECDTLAPADNPYRWAVHGVCSCDHDMRLLFAHEGQCVHLSSLRKLLWPCSSLHSLMKDSGWIKAEQAYHYHMGWNLQGVIAYLVGIALPFPGFVGTLGTTVSAPAQEMGHLGWMLRSVASTT